MGLRDQQRREKLGSEIAALLGPLVSALGAAFRICAEELELTQGEANTLWVLAASGELTTKELARGLDIDPANASTTITRLSGRGLVRRAPAADDRRKRIISLTEQGRQTREALAQCISERQPSFRALTTDELAVFRDLLRRVAAEGGVSPRRARGF